MTFKIIHDRSGCIGCGACAAVCPDFFEMADDGLATLKGSSREGEKEILEVKDLGCNRNAADSCPVNVIHIEDEKGEAIV